MDLKAILEANKTKSTKTNLIRKPVEIADQDRPYAIQKNRQQTGNNSL